VTVLVDSSAWIEFLRDTGSPVCREVERLLGRSIAVTDPIVMEVLAGARDESHLRALRGLLGRAQLVPVGSGDYTAAATLHRGCRARGETVRRLIDCLIAAVAIRAELPMLHADSDFEVLARHTPLRLHSFSGGTRGRG
jgi:predicted nucleic acid-binding protein